MKPDTTYPLHSDDDPQAASLLPPDDQQDVPLEAPSKYNQPESTQTAQSANVPWYLQPLTKTTKSPLTSTQTRPYIPRQPLAPATQSLDAQSGKTQPAPTDQSQQSAPLPAQEESADQPPNVIQAPPLSPFRSQPQAAIPTPSAAQPGQYQAPPRPPLRSPYQKPASGSIPKPFSQFAVPTDTQPDQSSATPAQPTKSKKKRPFIWIALALLIVAGLIAGMFALWRNTTANQSDAVPPAATTNAEDRLYAALENHLSTSKLHQVYEQTTIGADTSTLKLDTTSDFTDPSKPKSAIKYELKSGQGDTATDGAGELVVVDTEEYYGKLTKPVLFYQGADTAKPKENQWYQIASDDTTGEMLLDPLSARASINTSLGEIPVGNFNESTRQELTDFIKERQLYKIKSDKEVTVEGKKMTQYSVDVNVDVLNELNAKIVESLGGNPNQAITFTKSDTQTTDIWVSHDTSQIARVKIERESKAAEQSRQVKESTNLVLDYPSDISIDKPAGAVPGTWQTGR